ncbi:hypothetical protein BH10PSE14_BH10PSE14_07290 [soil metagenome]
MTAPARTPPTEETIARMARETLDFDLPAECLAGVAASLAQLADQARLLDGDA